MLRLLTDLNLVVRYDASAAAGLISNGVTGTFVEHKGEAGAELTLPSAGAVGVMQVFTESSRDGAAGKWSPDVTATGGNQLTVIYGKYRALTDQFVNPITAGQLLKVNADGKLVAIGLDEEDIAVAKCIKPSHNIQHLGKTWLVIEYVTL